MLGNVDILRANYLAFTAKNAAVQETLRLLGNLLRIRWLALEHDHVIGFKEIVRTDFLGTYAQAVAAATAE